jgi:DNA polymerase-3 subunit alpha
MAVFTLEDLRSAVEVMVFPRTMTDHGHKLADDAVVVVRGRVDKRDDAPKLIAQTIDVVDVGEGGTAEPLRLRVPAQLLSAGTVDRLKEILAEHPGGAPVLLHLGERQTVRLPERWNVDTSNGLLGELRVVLGSGAIVA